jgi:transposase-like protein
MTQFQFTLSAEELHQLFTSGKLAPAIMQSFLNQLLQKQATEQIRAEAYERTPERTTHRNGSYERPLTTRVGRITLQVPRLRNGAFSTELFERYQRHEKAFVLALMEMVVQGVSTRKVTEITEELCGVSFSKSTISELCKGLDEDIQQWKERSLKEQVFPFVIVDALYIKIREEGRIRSRSFLLATGINLEGYREILGFTVGDSESFDSWSSFFVTLKERGLHGVDFIVSDQHSGLVKAIRTQFQGCTWQRCQTHFLRNILDATPKSLQENVHKHVRSILDAPTLPMARTLLDETLGAFREKASKAMSVLEAGFDDALAISELPQRYRKRLRTTNSVERLNEEIRRRERVIRIFPNRESAIRLIGAMLRNQDEKWSTGRKYLELDEYQEWSKARPTVREPEKTEA